MRNKNNKLQLSKTENNKLQGKGEYLDKCPHPTKKKNSVSSM